MKGTNKRAHKNLIEAFDKKYVKEKEREQHLPGYYPQTSLEQIDRDENR